MAYKDITAGDKIAKVVNGRFIESKSGTMGLEIAFRFEEPSTKTFETLSWVGWLTPDKGDKKGALKNTMETLINVLGYNGAEETDTNGIIKDAKAFGNNGKVDCKLVVELEEGIDQVTNLGTGKFYPKVKYVNGLGGSSYAGVNVQTVKSKLASVGFKGAFLAAQQAGGHKIADTAKTMDTSHMGTFTADDIPF